MLTIQCHHYSPEDHLNPWQTAISIHSSDFTLYMIDILPRSEFITPGVTTSYLGTAGANSTRVRERKTVQKMSPYVKGSFDARYRGGSYTRNHTRPQDVVILTITRNSVMLGESIKEFYVRCNAPNYKSNERDLLGYMEYRLYRLAQTIGLQLNNHETPKHVDFPAYDEMSDELFFRQITFQGTVPTLIRIALGETTLEQCRNEQLMYARSWASNLLKS